MHDQADDTPAGRWPAGRLRGAGLDSRGAWGAASALLVVVHLAVVRLARYPEWDGTVFLSRSGGFEGMDAPPEYLVASRELGTPVLLGWLRNLSPSLANTRVLWILLALVVLAVALRHLGRLCGFPAPVAFALLGTGWLSLGYAGSFVSFFLAGSVMLAASAVYLAIRSTPHHQLPLGVLLGASLAACLWLRQVEGALFVGMLGLHSLAVRPRLVWWERRIALAAAGNGFLLLFVVPWAVDSARRFGSVRERVTSAFDQDFGRGLGIGERLREYAGILRGDSYLFEGSPPDGAVLVVTILLVAGLLAGVVGGAVLLRRREAGTEHRDAPVAGRSLLWLVGLGFAAFYVGYVDLVSDKYLVIASLFLLLGILATTWGLLEARVPTGSGRTTTPLARRPAVVATVAGLLLAWAGSNAVVADTYEQTRFEAGLMLQQNAAVIRALADGEECLGVSRYRAPQLQFGTGCHVFSAPNPAKAVEVLEEEAAEASATAADEYGFMFFAWPERSLDDLRERLDGRFQVLPLHSRPDRAQWMLLHDGGGEPAS